MVSNNTNETNNTEVNNAIYISYADMYYSEYINAKEIEDINKMIGIDKFVNYPEEEQPGIGGCNDLAETIFIPIAVGVFSSATFELLKLAVVELVKTMKKHFIEEKEKTYTFDFHIKDKEKGFSFDLTADANATSKEIEGLLDKAKEIIEIAKK